MRSLASFAPRRLENRSPVPLTERYNSGSWFTSSRLKNDYAGQMSVYGQDAVVYPIVRRLAEATAAPVWQLWEKAASGLKEDRKPVSSHPVLDLLARPNAFMSLPQLMEAGQQHSDLTGECNIVVGYMGGVKYPIDMWPVRPDRLVPMPDPYAYLLGWKYEIGGETVPLELNELIRHVLPSPLDPYRGIGPLQALMLDIDSQRMGKEWQAAFFENSARPGGIIEVGEKRLGDIEFNELRTRWAEQHKGVNKAHRVAILENGATWKDTAAFSMRDLQMVEMDAASRDKVLVAFGFPKSMLGIVEDVNRANAEAGEYMFAKWPVTARLNRWKGMFNSQLLPLFGKDVPKRYELDYESPVPENSEQALLEIGTKTKAVIDLAAGNFDAKKAEDYLGLPDLGYTEPPPPPAPIIPGGSPEGAGGASKQKPPPEDDAARRVDAAMRWVVKGEGDDNACEPCKENHGALYRNRQSAYADYPGGEGYIKCVGAKYGNKCRCTIVKRRGQ